MDIFEVVENKKNADEKYKIFEDGRVLLVKPEDTTAHINAEKYGYVQPTHICNKTGFFARRRAEKFVRFMQENFLEWVSEEEENKLSRKNKCLTLSLSGSITSTKMIVRQSKIKKLQKMLKNINFKLIPDYTQNEILHMLISKTS